MKKALHTFTLTEERSGYETSSYTEPYVSSVFKIDNGVHYNRVDGYLSFTSLQANAKIRMSGDSTPNVEYSRNYYDWEDWDFNTLTLDNEGDKIWFRGINPSGFNYDVSGNRKVFMSTGRTSLHGNIMTLTYGKEALGDYSLEIKETENNRCFLGLFSGNTGLTGDISLPSRRVNFGDYAHLFRNCTSWNYAPELPATEELGDFCYQYMFFNCKSLTEAPELPAMKVPAGGYEGMFSACTNLEKSPYLPATEIKERAYKSMFDGCSSMVESQDVLPAIVCPTSGYERMYASTAIVEAPEISAQTAGLRSFCQMFLNCKTLQKTPSVLLPKVMNASWVSSSTRFGVAHQMFQGCSSIEEPPILCATTLGIATYFQMFNGCSKLRRIPDLPSPLQLDDVTCQEMFQGCSSLTSIMNFPTVLGKTRSSGGFQALYGIFRNCTSLTEVPPVLNISGTHGSAFSNMFNNCKLLKNPPMFVFLAGSSQGFGSLFTHTFANNPSLEEYSFHSSVTGCALNTFAGTFSNCSNLKRVNNFPALGRNATITTCEDAFKRTFLNCTSLEESPIIRIKVTPGSYRVTNFFNEMFKGCTSLKKIYWLSTNPMTTANNINTNWVAGVPSGGTFYKSADATWEDEFGPSAIPEGWNVEIYNL